MRKSQPRSYLLHLTACATVICFSLLFTVAVEPHETFQRIQCEDNAAPTNGGWCLFQGLFALLQFILLLCLILIFFFFLKHNKQKTI
jgi:hypothetical protein